MNWFLGFLLVLSLAVNVLLALVLALGSTSALAAVEPGQTISSDSKWIV